MTTKQQLKARFFGMHIGSEVNASTGIGSGTYTICGAAILGDVVLINTEECGSFTDDVATIELVLRPLSDISDEEAIAALTAATGLYLCDVDRNEDRIVAVGVNHSSCAVIWLKISVNQAGTFIQAWNDIKGHSQPDCHDYLAVDYLRSLNFCLPFNGLDPIEEGWAVLEPQTTRP